MNLRQAFDKYKCDKGKYHGYERFYEPVFAPLRDQPITLLEIGILNGASVEAWLEYFPSANIVAVDTFQRVAAKDVPILVHPRVTWFAMDSTVEAPNVKADFIIDDGRHLPESQLATFNNYYPLLKDGGCYFIEDVRDFKTLRGLHPKATHHDMKRHFDSKIIAVPK